MPSGGSSSCGSVFPRATWSGAVGAGNRSGTRTRPSLSLGQRHLPQQPRILAIPVALANRLAHATRRQDQAQQVYNIRATFFLYRRLVYIRVFSLSLARYYCSLSRCARRIFHGADIMFFFSTSSLTYGFIYCRRVGNFINLSVEKLSRTKFDALCDNYLLFIICNTPLT